MHSFLPDVVILSLAYAGGLATLAAMRVVTPAVKVVALALTETEDEIIASAEAGVAGFLPRRGTLEDLELTVAGVVRGETICSPRIAAPCCGGYPCSPLRGPGTPTPPISCHGNGRYWCLSSRG